MNKLSNENEIWVSNVAEKDIQEAIKYATISLPWTFDRLRKGYRSQRSVNERLIHICVGVMSQSVLERELTKKGYTCSKDWTNYRESDIFDFKVNGKIYDVKTFQLYNEYNAKTKREPFSRNLLIDNKDYSGPCWKNFFPMMVTKSQIVFEKKKDTYIFGIGESFKDPRKLIPKLNDSGFWCSAPFDISANNTPFTFFQNKYLIKARESNNKGFHVILKYVKSQNDLYEFINESEDPIEITLFGEWKGSRKVEKIVLEKRKEVKSKNQFSSLSCIRCDHPAIMNELDEIIVSVDNKYQKHVFKPTSTKNLNNSDIEWKLNKKSFVNLSMPEDYIVYWVGHIPFDEFASRIKDYNAYFCPLPGKLDNQDARLTPGIEGDFANLDRRRKNAIEQGTNVPWPEFSSMMDTKNKKINAGFLISQQCRRGPLGATSYYYPIPQGMQETAIYVLPKDLYVMDDL